MVASKVPQIFGFVMMVLVLPIIIVIAMMLGLLAGIGSAEACEPVQQQTKPLGYPTETDQIAVGFSEPDSEGNSHLGVDFEIERGKKVFAASDGKVKEISGGQIKIEHEPGKSETWYKFVEEPTVRVHEEVKRGDIIAKTGGGDESSPGTSGDHLHFEWHTWTDEDGPMEPVDPEDQLGPNNPPPSGGGCGCSVGPDNLTGANNPQKAFNYLVQVGYTKEQAAGVVGNMMEESMGVNPTAQYPSTPGVTPAQALQNNSQIMARPPSERPPGSGNAWGIVQWWPASKIIYEGREGGKSDEEIASLPFQLDFLRRQLIGETAHPEREAGNHLKSTTTVEQAAKSFGMEFERFTQDWNHPSWPVRIGNAQEILNQYGAGAPEQGSGAANPAGGGCAGNGNIVATAKSLAWPKEMPDNNHESFGNYEEMVRQHNPGAGTHTDVFTDCGVYVATVMKMSGADPDFPPRGTPEMLPYLQNSPKYASQTSGVPPPGSIFITDGHIYLYLGPYTGSDGRDYNAATASLYDHTPEASWYDTDYIDSSGRRYTAYYLKNPPAGNGQPQA